MIEKTAYNGSFIYKGSIGSMELDYVLTPKGMIEMNGTTFVDYKYFLKDHLGNTRTVFSGDGFGRYGTEDEGGDHYLKPGAVAALFGLSVEMTNEKEGFNVDWGDMSAAKEN